METFVTMKDEYNEKLIVLPILFVMMISMLREDVIYCDNVMYRWTVRKQEGYFSYTDFFRRHFKYEYGCTNIGTVYPKTAHTVNFS